MSIRLLLLLSLSMLLPLLLLLLLLLPVVFNPAQSRVDLGTELFVDVFTRAWYISIMSQ